MFTLTPEQREAFDKENGMSIEAAVTHIEQWIEEGGLESAEAGIAEIKKFAGNDSEFSELEAKLRAKKAESVQVIAEKKDEITLASSTLETVTKSEKFIAGIGYFGYLCVLPLVLKKDSEFCQYHGKQALILAIVFTFLDIVSLFLPGGMGLMAVLHVMISAFAFTKANSGKLWNLPVFGDMSRKLPL